jgi:hypothetical protein
VRPIGPAPPMKHAQFAAIRIVAMIEGLSSVRSAAQAMGLRGDDLCHVVATMAEAITAAHERQLSEYPSDGNGSRSGFSEAS